MEKKCTRCGIVKKDTDYYKDTRKSDGLYARCKKCHVKDFSKTPTKEYSRKYRNSQKRIEYMKNYKMTEGYTKKTREAAMRYRGNPENKLKIKAREKFATALKFGKLKKPETCETCKNKNIEGHHPDYSKPLEVLWLCKKHHELIHVL